MSIRKLKKENQSLKEAYTIWKEQGMIGSFRYFLNYEIDCFIKQWLEN